MEEVEKGIKSTKEVGEEAGDSCGDMKALRRKDLYLGIGGGERNSSKKMGRNGKKCWRGLQKCCGVWGSTSL